MIKVSSVILHHCNANRIREKGVELTKGATFPALIQFNDVRWKKKGLIEEVYSFITKAKLH